MVVYNGSVLEKRIFFIRFYKVRILLSAYGYCDATVWTKTLKTPEDNDLVVFFHIPMREKFTCNCIPFS